MSNWSSKVATRLARLRRLRRPTDAVLFVRILLFAACVPVLARLPLPRLASLLEPRIPGRLDPIQARLIMAYADDAIRLGPPLVRARRLTRGMTLYYFLRRAGLELSLAFGKDARGSGHCWLVRNGEPFLELGDPRLRFRETYRISPSASAVSP